MSLERDSTEGASFIRLYALPFYNGRLRRGRVAHPFQAEVTTRSEFPAREVLAVCI